MINANDIQARVTSAVQSGSGPDIILVVNNWPQLYADSVADVSDLAEEIGKAQGGFYDVSRVVASDGKKWIAMPWTVGGGLLTNRKVVVRGDRLQRRQVSGDLGVIPRRRKEAEGAGPSLWSKFSAILSATHPYSGTRSLWSWGGKEVEADGKTVVLSSKVFLELGQIRGRLLERLLRSGRPRLE